MGNRWLKFAPLGVLAFVLIVAYWRLWVGEAFFWGLPALQFVPWRAYGLDALRAGHLPLWNPYNGGGAPLFANYQSAFLYPLNWLGVFTPSYAALGWLMSVTAVFHLFLGGVGMWLYAGRLEFSLAGRGVSTLGYALTMYTVARLGTYPIITVTAWIPFLLWSIDGVFLVGSRRDYGWLAGVVGLMLLGGHAQTAWYGLLLAGIYTVWRFINGYLSMWRRLIGVLASVLLGVGIASLQLIATADLTLNSQRSGGYGAEAEAFRYSYSLARSFNLLAPNFIGNPGDGSYLGRGLVYEYGTYVGLITLVSAVIAVLAWGTRRRVPHLRDIPFWLAVLVVGFILSLGLNTPIFPFLYRHVPTFDMFQAPVRWHLWTVFAVSVMGGLGVNSWGHGRWVIFWTRLTTAAAVGGGLLAAFAPRFLSPELLAIEGVLILVNAVGMTLVWTALAGVLTLLYAPNVPDRFRPLPDWWGSAWAVAVIVVLALDVGWATRGLNPTVPARFYNPIAIEPADPQIRGYWSPETFDLLVFGQGIDEDGEPTVFELDELDFIPLLYPADYRYPTENWEAFRQTNLPNMNLLNRQYLFNNNEPLQPAEYARYLGEIPPDEALLAGTLGVADELAIGTLYTLDGAVTLPDTLPRVALVGTGRVVRVTDDYNVVEIVLSDVEESTTLMLADLAFPDWHVTVDGETVNFSLLAPYSRQVVVPAGDSVVRWEYRPIWLLPGILASSLSLLIWLVLILLPVLRQTPPESA